MDPRNPFSLTDAPPTLDLRDLQSLVSSRGYQNFLEPFLFGIMSRWTRELADPSLVRASRTPDDYLRGGIKVCEALLKFPHLVIADEMRKAREAKAEEEQRRQEGVWGQVGEFGHGPIGEDAQGISPSDPI